VIDPNSDAGVDDMSPTYTAVIQQHEQWWIGWVQEVPGVNSQAATREELLENLRDALTEALEMNREDARQSATGSGAFEEVELVL
jgi:predicted RNase H-like HicB family nuclease